MIDLITAPWDYPFMVNAIKAILLVGIICGATGVFVILRGLAFLGDALAHAIFPGIVIAFILGGNFLIGALIAAVVVSLGIGAISQGGRINNDTAVGVLFVGSFSLGIAIMSTQSGYIRDLNNFLFGSILSVRDSDLNLTMWVGAIVLGTMLIFRREFVMIALDRTFAKASGINLWLFDQIFLVILALAIVISIQTVGNVLVLAMLVTPAATARLITNNLRTMMILSCTIGSLSGIAGLYVSYYRGIPSGSAVVLVATVIFGLVFLFEPRTGAITSRVRHRLHHPHPEKDEEMVTA